MTRTRRHVIDQLQQRQYVCGAVYAVNGVQRARAVCDGLVARAHDQARRIGNFTRAQRLKRIQIGSLKGD